MEYREAMRVGVSGAAGRMGRMVCAAVAADPGLELVAGVDPHAVGEPIEGIVVEEHLHSFVDRTCDVVVDFTIAAAARNTLPWLALHGIHAVVGTTGFSDDDMELFESAFAAGDGPNCVVAPNFAISAVLMMRFAAIAAPLFDTVEVIELHHDRKVDSPSGTAMATVAAIEAARTSDFDPDPTEREVLPGARGGAAPRNVRVHSVRMRGMVAHQEVIMGAQGQTLTIRQDSYDRDSFMPGVLLACRRIADVSGLSRSLDPFLP
jgi:4-hydroxy-tetrahydrodipicolinate reductase